MHRYTLRNEELVDSGSLSLAAGQVGLLSGWGVFSTVRVYEGVLFAFDRHWRRMQNDAARLRVPLPPEAAGLERELLRLVEANGAYNSTLRICVVRNKGGMWEGPGIHRDYDVVAFTADVNNW